MEHEAAARLAGLSRSAAYEWHNRYQEEGIGGLRDRPRLGRQRRVDAATSARFEERIVAGAALERDGVVAFRGVDAQRILKEEFEIDCSLSSAYRLLHRIDLEATHILAKPSNDIDTVQALFSADKGAYVGYSTCDAPFYLLLKYCVRSLRQLVQVHPRLSEVKQLFARTGQTLPSDFGQTFMPGMAVIARQRGDTISTVGLLDLYPAGGSIMLHAGWEVEGEPFGALMRDTSASRGSC
jgi:transposase